MKKLKKLAIFCTALMLSLGMSAFAACNNTASSESESSASVESSVPASESEENSEEAEPTDCYKFIVVDEAGNPVANIGIQLCTADNTMCYMPVATNADGICYYGNGIASSVPNQTITDFVEGAYVVHLYDADGYSIDEIVTPATFSEVTVVVKAA